MHFVFFQLQYKTLHRKLYSQLVASQLYNQTLSFLWNTNLQNYDIHKKPLGLHKRLKVLGAENRILSNLEYSLGSKQPFWKKFWCRWTHNCTTPEVWCFVRTFDFLFWMNFDVQHQRIVRVREYFVNRDPGVQHMHSGWFHLPVTFIRNSVGYLVEWFLVYKTEIKIY